MTTNLLEWLSEGEVTFEYDDTDVEGHLFFGFDTVLLTVKRNDGQYGQLPLRFAERKQGIKFRTKLITGLVIASAAMVPATAVAAAPSYDDIDAQHSTLPASFQDDVLIVTIPDGSSSGEDNRMGSAVAWVTRVADSR